MKKLLFVLLTSFLSICYVSAQSQKNEFSFAGNLNYGGKIESLGLGLRAQYGFTEYIRGAAEYKYYIERHGMSAWNWSINAHYVVDVSRSFSFYPIGGLSLSRWTYDPDRLGLSEIAELKYNDDRLGLNIGLGAQIATGDKTFIQIELKEALVKNYSQFEVSVGFMYQF
jgi:hypothetical protein